MLLDTLRLKPSHRFPLPSLFSSVNVNVNVNKKTVQTLLVSVLANGCERVLPDVWLNRWRDPTTLNAPQRT